MGEERERERKSSEAAPFISAKSGPMPFVGSFVRRGEKKTRELVPGCPDLL